MDQPVQPGHDGAPQPAAIDILRQRATRLFIFLGGFFVANAMVAEFIGVKIFALEPTLGLEPFNFNLFGQQGALQFSAGVLLWPIVFVMTDLINEYYGKRGIRLLSFLTVGLIGYAFVMIFSPFAWRPPTGGWSKTRHKVCQTCRRLSR